MPLSRPVVLESANPESWGYFNPVRITGGSGALNSIGDLVPPEGTLLVVTSTGFTRRGVTERLVRLLGDHRVVVFDRVTPNPEVDDLDQIIQRHRPDGVKGIVALGGGSVIDAGKALGVGLVCRHPQPLRQTMVDGLTPDWTFSLPVVAIPTTAGTGAEVTPFATVWDRTSRKKFSLANPLVFPTWAILDPDLTLSLPQQETLFTGLDACSHALESLWNRNRTSISGALATQSLKLGLEALPLLLREPNLPQLRAKMQQASLLAGLAISQTRTALAHSISYPFTSHFGVPHGLACSFSLPALIQRYLLLDLPRGERALIEEAHDFLLGLHLDQWMSRYVRPTDCEAIWSEMHHPGRAENAVLPVPPNDIRQIVLESLGPC